MSKFTLEFEVNNEDGWQQECSNVLVSLAARLVRVNPETTVSIYDVNGATVGKAVYIHEEVKTTRTKYRVLSDYPFYADLRQGDIVELVEIYKDKDTYVVKTCDKPAMWYLRSEHLEPVNVDEA